MEDVLEHQSKLGNGAQANIDLYKPKASAKKLFNAKIEQYAVKTYSLLGRVNDDNEEEDVRKIYQAVRNEVQFLRQFYACENIITLECVFKG